MNVSESSASRIKEISSAYRANNFAMITNGHKNHLPLRLGEIIGLHGALLVRAELEFTPST